MAITTPKYISELEPYQGGRPIKEVSRELGISAEKIVDILPKIIAYVQKFKKLSGDQKKALIIQILNVIIDKTDGPGDDAVFDPILKRLVPVLIDTFIKIENKELKFKPPGCLGKCLTKCCS